MHSLYEAKCHKYSQEEIIESKGNAKKLWKALHGVLGETSTDETMEHTVDNFASSFNDKVVSVHVSTAAMPLFEVPYRTTPTLSEWTTITVDEIDKLMTESRHNIILKLCIYNVL